MTVVLCHLAFDQQEDGVDTSGLYDIYLWVVVELGRNERLTGVPMCPGGGFVTLSSKAYF